MKRFTLFLLSTVILLAGVSASVAATDPRLCITAQSVSKMPDTPKTIRQQIVDKLKLRLARISTDNGFQTNLGETAVEDWPTNFGEGEIRDATRLGIFDQVNKSDQTFPREKAIPNTLPLQVRIFHKRGTTPAEIRTMIGDVMKAIIEHETTGERDPTFDGLAVDTTPDEDGFIIPREVFSIEGAAVGFSVEFYSEPFNAYE